MGNMRLPAAVNFFKEKIEAAISVGRPGRGYMDEKECEYQPEAVVHTVYAKKTYPRCLTRPILQHTLFMIIRMKRV